MGRPLAYALYKGVVLLGVVGVPPRQRRPPIDQVISVPLDPPLVQAPRRIVVRAQDKECILLNFCQHEFDDLLRGPRTGRLFRNKALNHAGIGKAWHQQVCIDLAPLGLP